VSSSATPANPAPDQEAADDRFENVRAGDDAKERAIFVMSMWTAESRSTATTSRASSNSGMIEITADSAFNHLVV